MSEMKKIISEAGGVVALSKAIGHRTHTSVLKWKKVPANHILAVEAATGIPREELRPDLYTPRTTPLRAHSPTQNEKEGRV